MIVFRKPVVLWCALILFAFLSVCSSDVSISVSPRTLLRSRDPVAIWWSGVTSPSKLDWVGIYSPANSSHEDFIGYVFLSSSPGWDNGSGFISIPLVNLRSSYQFRIFRWNESEVDMTRVDKDHNPLPGTEHLLVESEEIGFKPGRGPEQVHLALTGRDGEMRVMFVTSLGDKGFVRYGLARNRLDRVADTRVERYEKDQMCGAPANQSVGWRDPGYIHDGVMINLENKRRYFYRVGSDRGGWSNIYSFVSPERNSNETIAFLLGDMGTYTPYTTFQRTQAESKSTIWWISRDLRAIGDRPAIISHVGDISYARGYAWLWDTFFTQIEPIASAAPYHVCVGNHEYDWPSQPWKPYWAANIYKQDGGGECGVPFSLRFNMPGNSSEPTGTAAPATRNLYYSFDMGPVHFVYMSTETNFLPGSNQYQFLKQDLERVDRRKTPFIVFQGHRPMYTTSSGHKDGALRKKMVEHIEPLLLKNKVSLALWGHVHRYERFCPLNNFTCGSLEEHGIYWRAFPVHIVIGMGGQDWQPIWEPRPEHPSDPVFPQPRRSEFRAGQFGYARIVANMEKLRFSYVGNHDGKVHDSVEIMAPYLPRFNSTSHSLYHDL
ncbi:PREDICTED: probable inactive purple acid phosphatase 2 [Ipomoea nil]|uniref:probable inactive purple acid phosphatase 2 n=1 Tax=Ipomoea nil TaxID=35883 RepID=UPI00090085E9|nr:PREDICTED: probable inactive purple acid phosphatase 2 [Ipomoea nil]